MSRYNRCNECYNMKCVFVTGERTDFDTSECPDFRSMTNADRIRQMTDEELAWFLVGVHNNVGSGNAQMTTWYKDKAIRIRSDGWLKWLRKEADHE